MQTFSLKNLNEVEGKMKYRVEVSNKFAALEDLIAEVEIKCLGNDYTEYLSQRESRFI
jgi:hypothetical protein